MLQDAAAVSAARTASESQKSRLAWADDSRGEERWKLRSSELIIRISCSLLIIVGHKHVQSLLTVGKQSVDQTTTFLGLI